MNKKRILLSGCLVVFITLFIGCSTLNMERKPVKFTSYNNTIKFKTLEPDELEKKGVLLRLYQQNKVLEYLDIVELYAQIGENDNGIPFKSKKQRKIFYSPGMSIDDFEIKTETKGEELDEVSVNVLMLSNRGEILKFIKGEYGTSKGKLNIIDWSREAIFPKEVVHIGDSWSYTEKMNIKLNSYWLSRKVNGPDEIKVTCRLTGFAEVDGHRCAVIESVAISTKNESYTALFKTMNLTIRAHITEKIFFDYKRGLELAKVTKTVTSSFSKDMTFSDISKAQTISILLKNNTP
jgi:hypothetical protein